MAVETVVPLLEMGVSGEEVFAIIDFGIAKVRSTGNHDLKNVRCSGTKLPVNLDIFVWIMTRGEGLGGMRMGRM